MAEEDQEWADLQMEILEALEEEDAAPPSTAAASSSSGRTGLHLCGSPQLQNARQGEAQTRTAEKCSRCPCAENGLPLRWAAL